MPFTDKQVTALKPKAKRYDKMEPGRSGLRIRVTPKGRKSWTYLYRFNGNWKRIVFGSYPAMGVRAAHTALEEAKERIEQGIDPSVELAEVREAERNAETVRDLVDEYLERHARKVMKPATADEDERALNREVIPAWGKRKAKDITRRDAIKLLDKIEDRGAPVMRNRLAGVLSRLFNFAMDRGIVDASPVVRIRRLEEHARERVLTVQEIRSFWNNLDETDTTPAVRVALRFLLVTGQRRSEVARTLRNEIDDDNELWRLPPDRTKNGRENLIPLPRLAMRLIAEADKRRVRQPPGKLNRNDRPAYDPEPSPYLFPARIIGKAIEPAALSRAVNRNRDKLGIGDATVHDIRRSFATWHGELGTAPEILSGLLNHTPQSITARVYDRSVNVDRKRRAMDVWCTWLERIIAGEDGGDIENIVAFHTERESARA